MVFFQIIILNLLVPVDRSLPTTGQVELLQAKGGPWLAGHTRSLPLHFGHRTFENLSQFHLWIYVMVSTHFTVLWHWHCLKDPSVFYGTLLPVP